MLVFQRIDTYWLGCCLAFCLWTMSPTLADAQDVPDSATQQAASIRSSSLTPIDVSGFYSSIHHWRDLRDSNRLIQAKPEQASYQSEQVSEIVANILLYQRADGGWPKDYDMLAILTEEQRTAVEATRDAQDSSYDNNNLHSQVKYLAQAVSQSGNPQWRAACERGFDFMLRSQYSNGGFPQRFPDPKSYHAHITFNDGVMIGILQVLSDASTQQPYFAWLDERRAQKATAAVARGIDCILKCQIEVDNHKTGWCQQHDVTNYAPAPARTFELASICPQETTAIVQFLQQQPSRSPEIDQAITAARDWLKSVQLDGVRVERIASDRAEFERHTTDFDVVLVDDSTAKPLWARHYEIGTNRPIFAGRDGIKKYALADIERERRTGTAWYGGWPQALFAP